ncbi:MAG: ankyrin repeat domain-containing protein [Gemmatimonadota bacterium]|nr:ankyrin repeat domain-containing protein [Gemmatimonadota bacterium]
MTDPTEALLDAIRRGDAERANELLEEDRTLAVEETPEGMPLVLASVYHGQPEIADLLLRHGAPLDPFTAAALGRTDRLEVMLDRDEAHLERRSPDGWTPLHLAAYFGRRDTAAMLIDRGADLRARSENEMENEPLHAAAAGGSAGVVELLVERGAEVNSEAKGVTALDLACGRKDDRMVRFLVDHGAHRARKGSGS